MQYRPFGKTGFSVSALGLGAMRLPGNPFMPGSVDMKKAITLIRHAVDSGINYIDTAYFNHLGASERSIGRALEDGYRDKEANAWGTRDIILEAGKTKEFITWDTMYSEESITALLRDNGFTVEEIKTDLVRKNEFTSDDVMFVKAKKTPGH